MTPFQTVFALHTKDMKFPPRASTSTKMRNCSISSLCKRMYQQYRSSLSSDKCSRHRNCRSLVGLGLPPPSSQPKYRQFYMTLTCLKHLKINKLRTICTVSAIVGMLYPAPESTVGNVNKLKS